MWNKIKYIAFFTLINTAICYSQNNLSFQDFLNQAGKYNLNYLAEKYNVNIAEAEILKIHNFPVFV